MFTNKKANAFSIIIWMVSAVIIVFFLAGYLYFFNTLTNVMTNLNLDTNIVNVSYAVDNVLVPVNNAMNSLTWISFILIATLGFSILLMNFYIREHPVLIFFHVLIVLVAIVGSVYLANYYEILMTSAPLGDTLQRFNLSSMLVLDLPIWVAIIGVLGFVLLVINANRDPQLKVKGGL